jgi:arylsulfatase A-like enzyme
MERDPVLTPRMDSFAEQGTLFTDACCNSPLCTPSRASLITGMHPYSLNMLHNWLQLPTDAPSIAKSAKAAGYDTGYIGKWHLDEWDGDPDHGDAWKPHTPPGEKRQGFEFWYGHGCNHNHFTLDYMTTDGSRVTGEGWQVDHETDVAIDYLRNTDGQRDRDKPFCLYVSYSPPHTPFKAPEAWEQQYRQFDLPAPPNARLDMYQAAAPGYFGAVSSIDENFGRLLDALDELNLSRDTLVVLTADHGEMLGSHGLYTKDVWHEPSIGIPLIMRYPGVIPAGRLEPRLIGVVDYAPTLLALMGCDVPNEMHGADLSAMVTNRHEEPTGPIFLSHASGAPPKHLTKWDVFPEEGNRHWRGVRTERYTYAAVATEYYGDPERYPRPLPAGVKQVLFDNVHDPWQTCPIYPCHDRGSEAHRCEEYNQVIDELHGRLAAWLDELGDPFLSEQWK